MISDIYFDPAYGKLCEKNENGKAVCWRYSGPEGEIIHQFILRKIPGEFLGDWFDIITPYGYGGPLIQTLAAGYERKQLVDAFSKAFEQYCFEHRIVSEFVRFHPILNNAADFGSVYEVLFNRHTLGTNLKDYRDPVAIEFSKSCRKVVRQALNKGVSWRITKSPQNLETFKKIYYATMDRNCAGEYYYFDDSYFEECLRELNENIILVEAIYCDETVAAGLYFIFNKTIHAHLSGTLTEFLDLSPAYILKYGAVLWGKENGYELIHYGGGKSTDSQDSLYKFKQKFSEATKFDFYVGKKIWNEEMYDKLCSLQNKTGALNFFPAYRA